MKTLVTYSHCCKFMREGEREPGVMHSSSCRYEPDHYGELGPTLYLVDKAEAEAEIERLRAELEDLRPYVGRCTDCEDRINHGEGVVAGLREQLAEAIHQRDAFGQAIGEELVEAGILNPMPLNGPELLLALKGMGAHIKTLRDANEAGAAQLAEAQRAGNLAAGLVRSFAELGERESEEAEAEIAALRAERDTALLALAAAREIAERMEAERDAAIRELGEQGRLRGQAEAERDRLREVVESVPHTCWHHPHLTCGGCFVAALKGTP